MKKIAIAAVMLCITAGYSTSSSAADACEVVLCMYGKATGNSGGSACRSPEKAFFNIIKKGKHGFRAGATADARKAFLGQCKAADPAAVSKIISKFGRLRG